MNTACRPFVHEKIASGTCTKILRGFDCDVKHFYLAGWAYMYAIVRLLYSIVWFLYSIVRFLSAIVRFLYSIVRLLSAIVQLLYATVQFYYAIVWFLLAQELYNYVMKKKQKSCPCLNFCAQGNWVQMNGLLTGSCVQWWKWGSLTSSCVKWWGWGSFLDMKQKQETVLGVLLWPLTVWTTFEVKFGQTNLLGSTAGGCAVELIGGRWVVTSLLIGAGARRLGISWRSAQMQQDRQA